MTNGRILAALLLLVGAGCYGGMIIERLPLEFFFVGTACYAVAGVLFWVARPKSAAAVSTPAPTRQAAPPPAPTIEMSLPTLDFSDYENRVVARDPEIDLDEPNAAGGEEFGVSSDISLPLEIQDERRISEQLEKLTRLLDSGHLTDAEFQVAKQKLLG